MVAKLRSDCKIAPSVGGSAAWPTSEAPARMATPRAAQNGTFQRMSRRGMEDAIGRSHDSTDNMVMSGVANPATPTALATMGLRPARNEPARSAPTLRSIGWRWISRFPGSRIAVRSSHGRAYDPRADPLERRRSGGHRLLSALLRVV